MLPAKEHPVYIIMIVHLRLGSLSLLPVTGMLCYILQVKIWYSIFAEIQFCTSTQTVQ